MGEEEEEVE